MPEEKFSWKFGLPIVEIWNRFWFAPETARNLGLTRFAFFTFLVFYFGAHSDQPWLWAQLPREFWLPVGSLQFFSSPPIPPNTLLNLHGLWLVLLVLSALGFCTKLSTLSAALVGNLLVETRLSFGETSYDDLGIVIFLFIFAFSPCGHAFSLDSCLSKKDRPMSWRYRWPTRLMWVVCTSVFFGAAVSKLKHSGLAWVTGDTVKNYFLLAHYRPSIDSFARSVGVGVQLANYPFVCKLAAGGALALELLSPLAIFSTKLRPYLVSGLLLLVVGIYFTSSSGFMSLLPLFFCWLNWNWVSRKGQNFRVRMSESEYRRDARELSLVRILFCGCLALGNLRWYPSYLFWISDSQFTVPPGLEATYQLLAPIFGVGFILALMLCSAGVYARHFAWVSVVLYLLYVSPVATFRGSHLQNLTFFLLLALAISPGMDSWTPKKLLANWRTRETGLEDPVDGWFFVFARVFFALMFFLAGLGKLLQTGGSWLDGETLRFWALRYHFWKGSDLGLWLAQDLSLCQFFSILVVGFELSFVLLLFFPRLMALYLPASAFFLASVYFVLDINFFDPFVVVYLVFLPYGRLWKLKSPKQPRFRGHWLIPVLMVIHIFAALFRLNAFPITDYAIYASYRSLRTRPGLFRLARQTREGDLVPVHESYDLAHYKLVRGGEPYDFEVLNQHIASLGLSPNGLVVVRTEVRIDDDDKLSTTDEVVWTFETN